MPLAIGSRRRPPSRSELTSADTVVFLVLGLGPGAIYGALGVGVVITYRGSGVINLAHGAMAMYPTYVYAELRRSGSLVLPGIPGSFRIADEVGTAAALAVAVVVGALLALCIYGVVVHPLRRAPALVRVVGAVGVLIVLQSVVTLRFGTSALTVDAVLPQHAVTIAGRTLPADRLYLVVVLAIVAVSATALYRFTRFGLASRGATESALAVELLGYSPVWLGAANWVIGGVLAALFGILLAPIAGLAPSTYSLLVVPALFAALAGRLRSVWATVGAGLALGLFQSQAARARLPWEWLGPQTVKTVLPFAALVGVLVALGTPAPRRGDAAADRLPGAPALVHPWRWNVLLFVTGTLATVTLNDGDRHGLVVSMIGAMLCLSLVILTGFAGQISLAQMSFAGIAGFVLSGATSDWGLPFPLGALAGALVAGAGGVIVGVPALRARGMTVAIMTLGAALAVEELVFRNLSNGVLSTNSVAPARFMGLDLAATADDGTTRPVFGLLVLSMLVLVSVGVARLRTGGLGRRMLAVRSNERGAAASGVNVGRTKLIAFGLSAFVAGLAGTLAGYQQGALSDQSFSISRSLVVLAVAYLGGIGSVPGAVIGGLVIPGGLVPTIVERTLHLGRYETLFAGVAVVVVALRNPEGVAASIRRVWARRRRAQGRSLGDRL